MVRTAALLPDLQHPTDWRENQSRGLASIRIVVEHVHFNTILIDTCALEGHQHHTVASIELAQ